METIVKVKLIATLKGSEVWEAGVYDAPVPPELIAEAGARTLTRKGLRLVEVLETRALKVVSIRSPEAITSISSVITSNLREGPIFEVEKKEGTPSKKKRKKTVLAKTKLALRG